MREATGAGNTIFHCQQALAKEIEKLTTGMLFEDAASGKAGREILSPMRFYLQNLPISAFDVGALEDEAASESIEYQSLQTEDAVCAAPWCNIKIDSIKTEGPNAEQLVKVAIIFGVYDSGTGCKGHEGLLNLFQRITERFMKEPLLAHAFRNDNEFRSEVAEENTHPYYFGVTTTGFFIKAPERELEGEWE